MLLSGDGNDLRKSFCEAPQVAGHSSPIVLRSELQLGELMGRNVISREGSCIFEAFGNDMGPRTHLWCSVLPAHTCQWLIIKGEVVK